MRREALLADLDPALAQRQQERCQTLGQDGDLGLLERDRDDLAALDGLQEESALAGLADGAGDETVGWIKGVDATRHVDLRLPRAGRP